MQHGGRNNEAWWKKLKKVETGNRKIELVYKISSLYDERKGVHEAMKRISVTSVNPHRGNQI